MRICVAGSSGFIGGAVVSAAHRQGVDIVSIRSPRLRVSPDVAPTEAIEKWIENQRSVYEEMIATLKGSDVLVNAAGLASPTSRVVKSLYGANSTLPGLLATAAAEAGVRRMVHVSSAASQGRLDPLDETPFTAPVTPYADSKARGEAMLLNGQVTTPQEIVVYRPTSVQGVNRTMTQQLIRLAGLPAIPTCGRGEAPLPITLIENVAAGIVHVCLASSPPAIVLQPWEGMTVHRLIECFGQGRLLNVPSPLARSGLGLLRAGGHFVPTLAATSRRLELIAFGQRQDAQALPRLGFTPPLGRAAYGGLAERAGRGTV